MCSPAAASTVIRGATDVMTFGTAEVGGISKKIGETGGNIIVPPTAKTPAPPASVADVGPVQKTEPTTTTDGQGAAAQRLRRAAALRAGILSTIGPNLGSIGNTTPNMPAAYATGMKTALGQ